jgi:hypothetical protein
MSLAARLRLTSRTILARTRGRFSVRKNDHGAICGLLKATCGTFASLLANESVDASGFPFFRGFFLGLGRSFQCGEAIKEQLGNVSKGNGVATGDAFTGKLPDEIAEEEIHGSGGGEIMDVAEKIGGEDFGLHGGNGGAETVGVVSAEHWASSSLRGTMILVNQHVTAVAFGADVLALMVDGNAGFVGHG